MAEEKKERGERRNEEGRGRKKRRRDVKREKLGDG